MSAPQILVPQTLVPLALDRLEKRYGTAPPALAALSLDVAGGELLGLVGPSGCGKTTALRLIAGLTPASAGRVLIGGRDVTALPAHARGIGLVFQNYALFPHMTAADNVAFGLRMRGLPTAERRARTAEALAMVRLSHLGGRKPRALSGGQQQRVALARALAIRPNLLLLDEPLSNLDAGLRAELLAEIRALQRRLGITALFVTHDQGEALAVCDRIAVLRDGRLEQIGTPREVHDRPASGFVAGFVGRTNRIPAERLAGGALRVGETLLPAAADGPAGPVDLFVRPHRIRVGAAGGAGGLPAVLRGTAFLGDRIALSLEAGGAPVTVDWPVEAAPPAPGPALAPGDTVALSWDPADMAVFAATRPADAPP
ncbi:ABC transporter ATP-binding protein [Azospirillum sp. Vi22]|uniref:ABC transporter ATP-binding protein n=1 Tax=Azospirillum baldaniorum TaxID=1064539 RepID=UPI001B3C0D3A|nr:ABC transporter ATP-binding protein [Azospirillum baldaniorum]NUB10651.1 ABC transporter ATP-binding protein [Azospirillum baldaniorum]